MTSPIAQTYAEYLEEREEEKTRTLEFSGFLQFIYETIGDVSAVDMAKRVRMALLKEFPEASYVDVGEGRWV